MRADITNPYVGLRPFEVDESILFFGRNDQTFELLQRLHQHHFVAVVGSSGCGKSSLLRAGLIPALKAGYLVDDSDHWAIAIMKPGQNPLYNLADAILKQVDPETSPEEVTSLVEKINEEGVDAILDLISPFRKEKNVNFFLLVDQFEEIFRFAMDQKTIAKKDEAIDFVNIMLELSQQSTIPFYVVITMRSDFIGDCAQFSGLPEAMNKSQYLVPRLNRLELKTAIEGPAKLYGGKLNPSLTSKLLNELGKVKDELPLLQHALMRMWDFEMNVNKSGELDMEDYQSIGGIEKALNNHADEAMNGMSENELETTKKIFQNLTTIDENGRKIRRMMRLSQLVELTGTGKDELLKIINRFIEDKRSFVVINKTEIEDDPLIDISHESLIRQWDKLNNWVDEEGESAKNYLRLVESAELNRQNKKDLLSGSELQIALNWFKEFRPGATWAKKYNKNYEEAFQYLLESENQWKIEEARKKANRRKTLAIISAVTIIVIIGLVYFLARVSKANDEATIAKNKTKKLLRDTYWNNTKNKTAENDYVYALANATEAIKNADDSGSIQKILTDIEQEWPLVTLTNMITDPNLVSAAIFDGKDSSVIITASNDFILRKWSAKTGEFLGAIPLELKKKNDSSRNSKKAKYIRIINFTNDGEKIITTDTSNYLRLSNVKTGKEDTVFSNFVKIEYKDIVPPVFNRDGTKLISYDESNLVFYYYYLDPKNRWQEKEIELTLNLSREQYYYYPKISNLVLNRDGKNFLFLLNDNKIYIGNTDTKKIEELHLELTDPNYDPTGKTKKKYYEAILNRVSFASNENSIITASKDSTVRIWNLNTKQQELEFNHKGPVQSAFLIPKINKIFSRDEEGSTYIWDRTQTRYALGHSVKLNQSTSRVRFRSDGKQILVVENNIVFLWDLSQYFNQDGESMFENLKNPVYSHDLKMIAVPHCENNTLVFRILNSETKKQVGRDMKSDSKLSNEQLVYIISKGLKFFSPDSKKLLTEINDTTLILWDIEKGKQIGTGITYNNHNQKSHTSGYDYSQADKLLPVFSPDSKKITINIDDTTRKLIDAKTGKQIGKNIPDPFSYDPENPLTLKFGTDSTRILFNRYSIDQISDNYWEWPLISKTKIWDVVAGKQVGQEIIYQKKMDDEILNELRVFRISEDKTHIDSSIIFSPGGKIFITSFKYDSICQIWDAGNGTQIGRNIKFRSQWIPFFSTDGQSILIAVNDSTVHFIDIGTGEQRKGSINIPHSSGEIAPIFNSDGKFIITTQKDGTIQLLNSMTGKEIKENGDFKQQNSLVLPTFSPDGKQFLTTDHFGFIRLWDTKTGTQQVPAMKYQKSRIVQLAFSPDGKKILTKTYPEDIDLKDLSYSSITVVIWDAETRKQIIDGTIESNWDVKFSHDGKLLWGGIPGQNRWLPLKLESGDLDISTSLLELQVLMASGYRFDFENNEKISLSPKEFREKKREYDSLAKEHYKTCRYPEFNFWKRFNIEDAEKIRQEKTSDKKQVKIDQFKILPELQKGDETQKVNNGSFLEPNQAIYSKNKEYLLAYQVDGNLVIYRVDKMEPVWSTMSNGYPAYKTIMQYDGNLVIYAADPSTTLGKNAIWSTNTWENNANARMVLEDDGRLVIYSAKNVIVWQSSN